MNRIVFLGFLFVLMGIVLAHGEEEHGPTSIWEALGLPDPMGILYIGTAISVLAILLALVVGTEAKEHYKKIIFAAIAIPIILVTVYLSATTVYLNLVSETGGPVHWHADFGIWKCDQPVELHDPTGIENRVGTPTVHEHNDNRIHIEGVLLNREDARLANFLTAVGVELHEDHLSVPTDAGDIELRNGEQCNGRPAEVQVFVYDIVDAYAGQTTDFVYRQRKLDDFEHYVLSPYANVPPGDCIVIEFDQEKERTEHLCESYRVAIEKGEMREG